MMTSTSATHTLVAALQDCTNCPLHSNCDRKVVITKKISYFKHRILFVGEAPGSTEDAIGEPFVGRSGEILEAMCKEADLSPAHYYTTNTVLCTPFTYDTRLEIRPPSKPEWVACSDNLFRIVQTLQPSKVIALGQIAHAALTHIGINHYHLTHPAYVLRSGGRRSGAYARFVIKLTDILKGSATYA